MSQASGSKLELCAFCCCILCYFSLWLLAWYNDETNKLINVVKFCLLSDVSAFCCLGSLLDELFVAKLFAAKLFPAELSAAELSATELFSAKLSAA